MSACEGASGCRYEFLFDLTHPPNPCIKCKMNFEIDNHTAKLSLTDSESLIYILKNCHEAADCPLLQYP